MAAKCWKPIPLLLCFLLSIITGCTPQKKKGYLSTELPEMTFTFTGDRILYFGRWYLLLNGEIDHGQVLKFDYSFRYFDKSCQTMVSCINAYAQDQDDSVSMYAMMKEVLRGKSDIMEELSQEDLATVAELSYAGKDVIEYETQYAKGFIFKGHYPQYSVYSFSPDEKSGFVLALGKESHEDQNKPDAALDFALTLAASIRFTDQPMLTTTEFATIFTLQSSHKSIPHEERVTMKSVRYHRK